MPRVVKRIQRPPGTVVRGFKAIGVATAHECVGKDSANVMDPGIKPLGLGMKLCGPAVTVECFPGDNSTIHVAMTLCQAGDVLVVNGRGAPNGMLGSQMSFQCLERKIGGFVIDGGVRDSKEIREMGFPCFARHVHPQGTGKSILGSVNVPIQCGGVVVYPGDIVLGDDDGVVVIPRATAGTVLQRSKARDKKETEDRKLYRQGRTSMELLGLHTLLEGKNVEVER